MCPRVADGENGIQMWPAAANMWKKQSPRADILCFQFGGLDRGAGKPLIVKTLNMSKNCDIASWNQATRRLKRREVYSIPKRILASKILWRMKLGTSSDNQSVVGHKLL